MRTLVLWCPDWPVVAADAAGPRPCAVVTRSAVVACNAGARHHGVRRGMRRRDAQARCPELLLVEDNPDRDARAFEPVLTAVEELRPGVAALRPGVLAVRAPGKFYGGEVNAAATLAQRVVETGVRDVRVGVADDLFTAEQAARLAELQGWRVIEPGTSAAFLSGLPVEVLAAGPGPGSELVGVLRRLGLTTLGDLAALPARDVLTRFGAYGAQVHRLARGVDPVQAAPRTPPPDLVREVVFEPPLALVEAVTFSVRRTADAFVAGLADRGLVCTALRVEAEGDDVGRSQLSARTWVHSRWFGAADVVDRVHWQLSAGSGAPVGLVRFVPETVETAAEHAEGLWGGGTDELIDRGVAKVQALLGYDAVVVPVRQGGRGPAMRQLLVPWGERPRGVRPPDLPWPGGIPSPAPSRVFAEPLASAVVGENGQPVAVSDRGVLTCTPSRFLIQQRSHGASPRWQPIDSWAGPWPVEEQWWEEGASAGLVFRFQVVGVDGRAWLMRCDRSGWWVEASYD